jgi:MFS family permease
MAGYRTISLTVSTAVFMQFLDATALNRALPSIARNLHAAPADLNVTVLVDAAVTNPAWSG